MVSNKSLNELSALSHFEFLISDYVLRYSLCWVLWTCI